MELTLSQLQELGSSGFPGLLGIKFEQAGDGFIRAHLALEKDAPESRPASPPNGGPIVAIPQVGGLHRRYERRAA